MPWNALAQSIADGEAVLVLGPDAIPMYPTQGEAPAQEMTFSRLSRQRVLDNLGEQINHYYERDNLFQFNSSAAKQQAMKEVRNAARDTTWLPDSELLRQIAAIPFPLVLNMNPDKWVYEAFIKYYREPQFDYFTTKDKPNPPQLDYPDGLNKPLVYNLCGSVLDKLDSVLLDYSDLFELLRKMLSDYGIDEALSRKLQDADRFILLGFELDRWYFQLLLHYLNKLDNNPFSNHKKNFPILSHVSDDARAFVMRQFNIEYIAANRQDFELLYQACQQQNILRNIHDPASPAEVQVRSLTVQGKYEEAFQQLEGRLGAAENSLDLPQLRARYNAWLAAKNAGTADSRDLDLEINRIRYTLLTLANQIPQP